MLILDAESFGDPWQYEAVGEGCARMRILQRQCSRQVLWHRAGVVGYGNSLSSCR